MELNETQVNETAEVQETVSETETNFAEELEKTFKSIRRGQIVTGFVVHVNDDEIAVNIGYKADGLIKLENMGLEEGEKPADKFHEGDEIEAQIVDLNDGEGNVVLSRKKIESQLKWKEFVDNLDMDAIYECTVTKTIKGGVLTKFNGYDAFIPASQLTEKYVEDLSTFVGQNLLVKIIDVDKKKKRFVLSNKAALIEQKEEQKKMIFQSFEQGSVVRGVVKRLTDFGAFVDVGGVDGLLHVTDMSWSRVAHPKDVLSNGQEIDVKILKVDPEKGRISLGYKQLLPKPWETVTERYAVGDVVKGKVVRIAPFGAFVELEPTIDGLVHISQVTNHRIEKVEDALQLGQEIEAKVLEVNPEKKRISLSIRALMNDRKAAEAAENPADEEAAPKRPRKEERVIIPPKENATTSLADLFKAAEEAANFEEAVEESEEE
jgi:4-hydroxy-3-methylbut-2-enyl diphosphate reductase